jgi:hypothetical protein
MIITLVILLLGSSALLVSAVTECDLAEPIGRPPFTQSTVNIAPADGFVNGACQIKANSHTMWYKFTAYRNGIFAANVFDQSSPTTLSVFLAGPDGGCGNLECIEYFGNYQFINLYVEFPAVEDEVYYIAITSEEGGSWKLDFRVCMNTVLCILLVCSPFFYDETSILTFLSSSTIMV